MTATESEHACWAYGGPGNCSRCGRPEAEHHNNQRGIEAAAAPTVRIDGYCPACGADELVATATELAVGLALGCGADGCSDPTLVGDLLHQPLAERSHLVDFTRLEGSRFSFTMEHTLRCRLTGLGQCPIHAIITELPSMPLGPGLFEVDLAGGSLWFRPRCWKCRCSWDRACEGGCAWGGDDPDHGPTCTTCTDAPAQRARPWPWGPEAIEVPVG